MDAALAYRLLADAVLLLHFAFVVFVIGGLLLVVAGNLLAWQWVNRLWFRLAHLAAIAVVVAQAWFARLCPLTTLESWLRTQAGEGSYPASFIGYWIGRLLFYEAPARMFTVAYTVFALLVLAAWRYFPPRRRGTRDPDAV